MSFRLLQKSVTLNNLEWRNDQSLYRQDVAAAILDFQILEILTSELKLNMAKLRHRSKFRRNRSYVKTVKIALNLS